MKFILTVMFLWRIIGSDSDYILCQNVIQRNCGYSMAQCSNKKEYRCLVNIEVRELTVEEELRNEREKFPGGD